MPLITVTALKAFDYRGRTVAQGASVDVPPVDALALARQGRINLSHRARRIETAAVVSDPLTGPDPEPARRRYRRRDLVAEP